MKSSEKLWSMNFISICIGNTFIFLSFYFLLPTLPIYVTKSLGGNESQVGYIIGILTLVAVIFRPLAGVMLDRLNRKTFLVIAFSIYALCMLAYPWVYSIATLFLLRVFHGMIWAMTTTASGTVVADIVPASRRGEGMGFFGFSNTIAMALGPLIALSLVSNEEYSFLFASVFVLALLGLLVVLKINLPEKPRKKSSSEQRMALYEKRVLPLSAVLLLVTFAYGGVVSFITIYAATLSIDNAGLFFSLYAIALLISRPFAGKHFDAIGPKKIIWIGFFLLFTAFIVLAVAQGIVLFLLAAFVLGLGFGAVHPVLIAMAINLVEPDRRGAANATIFSAFDLGIGMGSILLGYLSTHVGLSMMYAFCGILMFLPFFYFNQKVLPGYLSNRDGKSSDKTD